jgi:hypothetical protein
MHHWFHEYGWNLAHVQWKFPLITSQLRQIWVNASHKQLFLNDREHLLKVLESWERNGRTESCGDNSDNLCGTYRVTQKRTHFSLTKKVKLLTLSELITSNEEIQSVMFVIFMSEWKVKMSQICYCWDDASSRDGWLDK